MHVDPTPATTKNPPEHLAMIDHADDPATSTTWLEHVTDEEYVGS